MIKGRSIHAQTVDRIASWITKGRFRSGDNLPTEQAVCAELGVSRTIVREAIKTLVAKGLISTGPRVGSRVLPASSWNLFDSDVIDWRLEAGVDRSFIDDLIQLRMVVETSAAEIAATVARRSDRDCMLARYADLEAAMTKTDFRPAYLAADLAYHQEILVATGNQFYIALAPMLASVLRGSFMLSIKSRLSIQRSLPYHKEIAEAIAAGEGEKAARIIRLLIQQARLDMLSDVENNNAGRRARKGGKLDAQGA